MQVSMSYLPDQYDMLQNVILPPSWDAQRKESFYAFVSFVGDLLDEIQEHGMVELIAVNED